MSVSIGSKGVGSKDLCKTNETQRAHRQCQSFVIEQRWHPGMCFETKAFYREQKCHFIHFNVIM